MARLGHVHLKVRDLDRATAFYRDLLGLAIRERVGANYVFLSGSDVHHEVALQRVPGDAALPGRFDVGLFHTAFEVPDRRAFADAYRRLRAAGLAPALVDHRISWAMYFSDPDGNGLEIYCDTRGDPDGAERWDATDRVLTEERVLDRPAD